MEKRLPNGTKVYIFKNEGWRPAFSEEYIEGTITSSEEINDTTFPEMPLREVIYWIIDNNNKKHICLHRKNGQTAEFFRTYDEQIEYINHKINDIHNELSNLYKELENLTNKRIYLEQNKETKKHL